MLRRTPPILSWKYLRAHVANRSSSLYLIEHSIVLTSNTLPSHIIDELCSGKYHC